MKYASFFLLGFLLFIAGCAPKTVAPLDTHPQTQMAKTTFDALPMWEEEKFDEALKAFVNNCRSSRTKKLYKMQCEEAANAANAKHFFESHFDPYVIYGETLEHEGLLTGYYEPLLQGSRTKSERYRFPVYAEPEDLVSVQLSSLYPELKHMRLRGRLQGNKLVPYFSREELGETELPALCWVDDRVDLFFLEVQGSGRIQLDSGETIFIGYANQNGHPYRSIGKYLIEQGELKREEVSLQSIKAWLKANPERIDEVLHANASAVFFQQRNKSATGALGLELTAGRSIAIDRKFIPLGAVMYLHTQDAVLEKSALVMAQDTGGAIRGEIRADLFTGFGKEAERIAGELKAPFSIWMLLPKERLYEELARIKP